ncbi:hypothetical protein HDU67_007193 [Dinochytrium kinnereticum]|nr:hypothetical protein HDU67_007193 [Dinochytrium kinnereticum]
MHPWGRPSKATYASPKSAAIVAFGSFLNAILETFAMTAFITTLILEAIILSCLLEQAAIVNAKTSESVGLSGAWRGLASRVTVVWAVLAVVITDLSFIMMALTKPKIKSGRHIIFLETTGLSNGIKKAFVVAVIRTIVNTLLGYTWPASSGVLILLYIQSLSSIPAHFVANLLFPSKKGDLKTIISLAFKLSFAAGIANSLSGSAYVLTLSVASLKNSVPMNFVKAVAYSLIPMAASSSLRFFALRSQEGQKSIILDALKLESQGLPLDKGVSISRTLFDRNEDFLDPEEAYELGYSSIPHLLTSIYNVQTWYIAFTSPKEAFYTYVIVNLLFDICFKGITNRIRRRKELQSIKISSFEVSEMREEEVVGKTDLEDEYEEIQSPDNLGGRESTALQLYQSNMSVTSELLTSGVTDKFETPEENESRGLVGESDQVRSERQAINEERHRRKTDFTGMLYEGPRDRLMEFATAPYSSAAPSRKSSFLTSRDAFGRNLSFSEAGRSEGQAPDGTGVKKLPSLLSSREELGTYLKSMKSLTSIVSGTEEARQKILGPIRAMDRIGDHAADAILANTKAFNTVLRKKVTMRKKPVTEQADNDTSPIKKGDSLFRLRDALVSEAARSLAELTGNYISIMTIGVMGLVFMARDALFVSEDVERCSAGLVRWDFFSRCAQVAALRLLADLVLVYSGSSYGIPYHLARVRLPVATILGVALFASTAMDSLGRGQELTFRFDRLLRLLGTFASTTSEVFTFTAFVAFLIFEVMVFCGLLEQLSVNGKQLVDSGGTSCAHFLWSPFDKKDAILWTVLGVISLDASTISVALPPARVKEGRQIVLLKQEGLNKWAKRAIVMATIKFSVMMVLIRVIPDSV